MNQHFFRLIFLSSIFVTSAHAATFKQAILSNPIGLFPLTIHESDSSDVYTSFFESLLQKDWNNYDWKPNLASKWEVSSNGTVFTFWLDPKAKFSDGKPVTAEDVKFSYDLIYMKGVQSAVLRPFYESIAKVEVVNPGQIKFTVKDVYFKNFDVVAGLDIFPKHHYLALYQKDNTLAKIESTNKPLGTGIWTLERWENNQRILLKRNENYWNKEALIKEGKWNYDTMEFRIIQTPQVQFEAFKKGDLTVHSFNSKQWQLQTNGPEFKTRLVKVKAENNIPKGYGYLGWNQEHPVLKDKNVRWALSHCLNWPLWIKKFDFDLTQPAISHASPKTDYHDPKVLPVPFDLEKARERLKQAGWVKVGKDGVLEKEGKRLEISILYPTQTKETVEPKLTEYKNQAAKVGIRINLKALEWTSLQKLINERKFEGAAMAWTGTVEPDFKQIWHSASIGSKGSNYIGYSNPKMDELIDQHRKTLEVSKRVEIARKIEALLVEDQPYTFMTTRRYDLYGHQSSVKKIKDTFNYAIGELTWKLAPQ